MGNEDTCLLLTSSMHKLTLAGVALDVGQETPSAWMGLYWTLFTGVTPGPTNCGTAEGLGTDHSRQLTFAHRVGDLCETWPCSVI